MRIRTISINSTTISNQVFQVDIAIEIGQIIVKITAASAEE
jgi:hypothetical protein